MKIINEPIPADKFRQFHQILCNTGGRYISAPIRHPDGTIRVSYQPGDYKKQQYAWQRCLINITEKTPSTFKRLIRKWKGIFK